MAGTLRVRVPATTANVGSGFDCVGIALDLYDELELDLVDDPAEVRVEVAGEGAGQVPTDGSHLVVASIRRGLAEWGGDAAAPGLRLRCRNRIPHSRGLGSSASAIVAGLAFAWGIARPGQGLDRAELTRVSSLVEGHPDNAGAAAWGGAVLGWFQGDDVQLVRLDVADGLAAMVFVPTFEVPTARARAVLPESVPRADAVAQAIAAASLPLALSSRPELLLAATRDRLHQPYRRELMAPAFDLMERLRAHGVPATISGAGPTVFALGLPDQLRPAEQVGSEGFARLSLAIGTGVSLSAG